VFLKARHFAVHVLGADQMDLCRRFTASGDRWEGLGATTGAGDTPLLPGCLARFECRTEAVHDAGDHVLILGRIDRFETGEGAPLVFSAGRYGSFAAG
jgi:flavin reductase (DIM6/NTAB) family NADH-FMN oxidoreductase RutF